MREFYFKDKKTNAAYRGVVPGAPSDIKEEVNIVKEVVHKWNDLYSEKERKCGYSASCSI